MLVACGGGGSNTPKSYYTQGGLLWSGTLSGSLPAGLFLWNGVATFMRDTPGYQCSGSSSVNGGPILPDNFNKESGWRLPTLNELKALYAVNKTPPDWTIGMVWSDNSNGPQRLNFATGAVTSGNGGTGLVVCVKPTV